MRNHFILFLTLFVFNSFLQANSKEVHAHHILVKTFDKANELEARLIGYSGEELKEEFIKLAKEHSVGPSSIKGGDLGWFKEGMMVPSFNDAVFSMQVGTVSAPVKSPFGYHLIYLVANNKLALIKKQQDEKIQKQEQQIIVDKYVANNDYQGLKDYTDKNPNAVYYIQDDTMRLILTGPKDMKVGDIIKLVKNKRSELIITSLINRVKEPYKEFSLDEIDTLSKLGLSDGIISSMINVTTKLLENEDKRKQQEFLLNEQKKIAEQKTKVIYKTNTNQQTNNQSNPVQNQLINKGIGMLLDHLF